MDTSTPQGEMVASASVEDQVEYLVANGAYSAGDADELADDLESLTRNAYAVCTVIFDVQATASDFYEIQIADRGELSYSAAELADANFAVGLTLGEG